MNPFPGQKSESENEQQQPQVPAEIPSYPVMQAEQVPQPPQQSFEQTMPMQPTQEQYVPQAEQYVPRPPENYTYPPVQRVEQVPQPPAKEEKVDLYNKPEQQVIEKSRTPELQTSVEYTTTREGERFFQNPEEGQATFKGGVTKQQLVSKVSGYYTVSQGLINDPHSGLLQQTAQTGDPTQATTWQATMIYKVLMAFWKALGLV